MFGRRKKLQANVDEVWNEAVAVADKEAAEARAAALSAYEAAGPSGEKAYEEARDAIRRRYTQALSDARDAISRDLGPGATSNERTRRGHLLEVTINVCDRCAEEFNSGHVPEVQL